MVFLFSEDMASAAGSWRDGLPRRRRSRRSLPDKVCPVRDVARHCRKRPNRGIPGSNCPSLRVAASGPAAEFQTDAPRTRCAPCWEHIMNVYAAQPLASERCPCPKTLPLTLLPPAIRCISGSESGEINHLVLIFFSPPRARARGMRAGGSPRGIPAIRGAARPASPIRSGACPISGRSA